MFDNKEGITENDNNFQNNENLSQSEKITDVQENTDEKLFTQKEVDELIKSRLSRAAKSFSKNDQGLEMEDLRKETEESKKVISDLKKKSDIDTQKILAYEIKEKILKNGVDSRICDFALFTIKNYIDNGDDFEVAFDKFSKDNGFLMKNNTTTGLRQGGSFADLSTLEDSFYKINPNLKRGGF